MTISLERLKTKDIMAFSLMSVITSVIAVQIAINPYSREFIPIPNLGGIFYRSIFIICIMSLSWIYQYGWVKTFTLLYIYYGFQEFVFTQVFFGAYGQTMFQYLFDNLMWDIRIFMMLSAVALIIYNKWYSISAKSIVFGAIFFSYFLFLLMVWPFSYFNGEGNIPLQPLPQLQEFGYNLLFPIWFYFLVRIKK